jgi:hypothetical protein
VFFLGLYLHFWACLWLFVGRVDPDRDIAGWYKMDHFDQNPTWFEMYYEGLYFSISTFSGAGFGNVVPSTNFEWFMDTIFNLVGSMLFMTIFVDFVMEFTMRDLKKFMNQNNLTEMMQFAENASLPEDLVFKIRYYYKDLNLKFQDLNLKR